jgi:hypothetical protein
MTGTLSRWWDRLLGRDKEGFPILIRVMDARGKPCSEVRIEGVWLPSGRRVNVQPFVADGLCLLPWSAADRSLRAVISSGRGAAELVVEAQRRNPYRTHDVRVTG